MALPLPKLDDRTYADLVNEAVALIPSLCPPWTNHNPTDPGIVLIELFAWLSEMLLFRIDQIPEKHYRVFLKLLNDPAVWAQRQNLSLDDAVRETVLDLRERYRAVTGEDYVRLILDDWPQSEEAKQLGLKNPVGRVHCVPRRNLANKDKDPDGTQEAPGHVSVIIVPNPIKFPKDTFEALCASVSNWIEPRRLLGTRLHFVAPAYRPVTIAATLVLRDDFAPHALRQGSSYLITNDSIIKSVQDHAEASLQSYFAPLSKDSKTGGWTFGRAVYLSEVYQLLDAEPGVDFVKDVKLDGKTDSVHIKPHELVQVNASLDVQIGKQKVVTA